MDLLFVLVLQLSTNTSKNIECKLHLGEVPSFHIQQNMCVIIKKKKRWCKVDICLNYIILHTVWHNYIIYLDEVDISIENSQGPLRFGIVRSFSDCDPIQLLIHRIWFVNCKNRDKRNFISWLAVRTRRVYFIHCSGTCTTQIQCNHNFIISTLYFQRLAPLWTCKQCVRVNQQSSDTCWYLHWLVSYGFTRIPEKHDKTSQIWKEQTNAAQYCSK